MCVSKCYVFVCLLTIQKRYLTLGTEVAGGFKPSDLGSGNQTLAIFGRSMGNLNYWSPPSLSPILFYFRQKFSLSLNLFYLATENTGVAHHASKILKF